MRNLFHKVITIIVGLLIGLIAGEVIVRVIDSYPLNSLELTNKVYSWPELDKKSWDYMADLPAPKEVDTAWFRIKPDAYPATHDHAANADMLDFFKKEAASGDYQLFDILKLWNHNFLYRAYCSGETSSEFKVFRNFPNHAMAFIAEGASDYPRYRFLPGITMPDQPMRLNNFGFRGNDISLQKPSKVIRIAFLGASTTQQH